MKFSMRDQGGGGGGPRRWNDWDLEGDEGGRETGTNYSSESKTVQVLSIDPRLIQVVEI